MIETDSYDPVIICMKRIKSDLFIFRFQYPILGAKIPIDTGYFFVLLGFNRLFSVRQRLVSLWQQLRILTVRSFE